MVKVTYYLFVMPPWASLFTNCWQFISIRLKYLKLYNHAYYLKWFLEVIIVCIIIILLLMSFSHQCQLMVFHWNLSDNKSPKICRTLLNILDNLNNTVLWMVLAYLSISNPLTKPLGILPIVYHHIPQTFQFSGKI